MPPSRARIRSRSPSSKPSSSSRAGCSSRSTPTPASSAWASRSSKAAPKPCAEAVKEIEPYLIGKDPRQVVHHWQAIYRHAFYRGGPILTSALSGIDMALWDIKGKALGVPVYELLGGPTRQRVRVYAHARTPEKLKELKAKGFTAFKTGSGQAPAGAHTSRRRPRFAVSREQFAELRKAGGDDVDIAIDFHGAISPRYGQGAHQGAGAASADVHRGAVPVPEPRHHGRDRPRHASADRHRRARLHQVGLPRSAGEEGGDDLAAGPVSRRRHHRSAD